MSGPVKFSKDDLLAVVPALRAVANLLVNNPVRADDLVEEALLKASVDMPSYIRGTPLRIWVLATLHKALQSRFPSCGNDSEGARCPIIAEPSRTTAAADLPEFERLRRALQELPPDHREALTLVSASRLSYEEAARVCDCAVGTVGSRVDRARVRLIELLGSDLPDPFALDRRSREPSESNRDLLHADLRSE